MGLFLQPTVAPRPPRMSALAVVSLVAAVTGPLNVVGFLAAIVLGHISLVRLRFARRRGEGRQRGRRLAIAAVCIGYGGIVLGIGALLIILIAAYMALPSPQF